jgi:hypothetical protein
VKKTFVIVESKIATCSTKESLGDLDHKYQNFKQRTNNEFEQMQLFCKEMNLRLSELISSSRNAPSLSNSMRSPKGFGGDSMGLNAG